MTFWVPVILHSHQFMDLSSLQLTARQHLIFRLNSFWACCMALWNVYVPYIYTRYHSINFSTGGSLALWHPSEHSGQHECIGLMGMLCLIGYTWDREIATKVHQQHLTSLLCREQFVQDRGGQMFETFLCLS